MRKFKVNNKAAILLIVGVMFLTYSFKSNFFEVAKQIEIYNSLFKELNMYYVDEINPAELTNKAIVNTLKDLDPYTNFYNEQDVDDARIRREGEYGGVGISVYYTKKGIEIKEIYEGFAADNADLKPGDVIISVDNQSIENMERDQLSMFLKGTPESKVNVEIDRQGEIFKKQLTRSKVVVNPVPFYDMIDEETGYLILTRFNNKASAEVKKAYRALKKRGMKKLVFDLRSNPGGSLLESIKISNFFLPKGKTIVTTKGKIKEFSNTYRGTDDPLDLEIPIVVLVNGSSASASEIVSGSLQDYDRAIILGERSFGKGLVQRQKELTYGTQLKLTISKYYTPSGRCIQELDYTNRDSKTGEVPKFSDKGINKFKTENGRTVFDGGGVLPDVKMEFSEKTTTTKELLTSKAIFDYATQYYYQNPTIDNLEKFEISDSDFKDFLNYLKKDTTFVTKEEKLFKDAFNAVPEASFNKEYSTIKEKLYKNKIEDLAKNKDIIKTELKDAIIPRYFYKKGLFNYNLKRDETIFKALQLLKQEKQYKEILAIK